MKVEKLGYGFYDPVDDNPMKSNFYILAGLQMHNLPPPAVSIQLNTQTINDIMKFCLAKRLEFCSGETDYRVLYTTPVIKSPSGCYYFMNDGPMDEDISSKIKEDICPDWASVVVKPRSVYRLCQKEMDYHFKEGLEGIRKRMVMNGNDLAARLCSIMIDDKDEDEEIEFMKEEEIRKRTGLF